MNDGLIITFDPALDGDCFPGPLDGRDVVVGEAWLGPLGLINRLQTELDARNMGMQAELDARNTEMTAAKTNDAEDTC